MTMRKSICLGSLGSFQYRRAALAPLSENNVPIKKPVEKPRRKKTTTRYKRCRIPDIDKSLPKEQQLACLLEHGMKEELNRRFQSAASAEREEFEASMNKVLDRVRGQTFAVDVRACAPNEENEKLLRREAQLRAIHVSYRKELELLHQVLRNAEQEPLEVATLPEDAPLLESEEVLDAKEVLASSTRAIESYILQTDHVRSQLKSFESRNRRTQARVHEVFLSLNDRVLGEIGVKQGDRLTPPLGLVNVRTKDLNTAALSDNV